MKTCYAEPSVDDVAKDVRSKLKERRAKRIKEQIVIKEASASGIIIDIQNRKKTSTKTMYDVLLLYNSFQVMLTWMEKTGTETEHKMDIVNTEVILTDKDKEGIFNFLIDNIK